MPYLPTIQPLVRCVAAVATKDAQARSRLSQALCRRAFRLADSPYTNMVVLVHLILLLLCPCETHRIWSSQSLAPHRGRCKSSSATFCRQRKICEPREKGFERGLRKKGLSTAERGGVAAQVAYGSRHRNLSQTYLGPQADQGASSLPATSCLPSLPRTDGQAGTW